jgi:hypothetical protein
MVEVESAELGVEQARAGGWEGVVGRRIWAHTVVD